MTAAPATAMADREMSSRQGVRTNASYRTDNPDAFIAESAKETAEPLGSELM